MSAWNWSARRNVGGSQALQPLGDGEHRAQLLVLLLPGEQEVAAVHARGVEPLELGED